MQKDIVLSTLNARYQHSAFGLRYLLANIEEFAERTCLREYTLKKDPQEIVDELLALEPCLVGFGIYIWNTKPTLEVIRRLKKAKPDLCVVVGGPEVSHEIETQEYFHLVDHIFKGEADFLFRDFCRDFFADRQREKIVAGDLPDIKSLKLPYYLYNEDDIRNRVIYVEASRGCPYKCEYCLSSLDVSVRNFDVDLFLAEIDQLVQRGARQFKFVDRTFNLNLTITKKILGFFLERINLGLFLHFEMVPDRLPPELKDLITQFPSGSLQFEIGVQTWSPEVARNVSRRQDYTKIAENFRFLREKTGVHTHADLIVGLPGETLESFARGFDQLAQLQPDEIQVGILKRLKGAPICRRAEQFSLEFSSEPPFQILSNKDMSADEIQAMDRFASFWDAVHNSGRLPSVMTRFRREMDEKSLFWAFFKLSEFLWNRFQRTHSIHFDDLVVAMHDYSCEVLGWAEDESCALLLADVKHIGAMHIPDFLKEHRHQKNERAPAKEPSSFTPSRQRRHLQDAQS